ncbi:hypothetical protein SDC9_142106 [bioreactor metagenome]|uniref:Uncharacterized protein n=1 Tax=bioreactor metagenome TaxID=1076179 RepID=A0A645DZZ0_9ZZZZ
MRQRHVRDGELIVRAGEHGGAQPQRAADDERNGGSLPVEDGLEQLRKLLRVEPFSADSKADDEFARRDTPQQSLAFLRDHLRLLRGGERLRRFFVRNLADFQRAKARKPLCVFRSSLAKKSVLQFSHASDLDFHKIVTTRAN